MAKETELKLEDIDDNDPEAPSQLRQFAERAGARGARADQLERELAFEKAGIDTESRLGKAWASGYEGDIHNKDAILADAKDFAPSIIRGEAVAAPVVDPAAPVGEGVVAPPESTGSAERGALNDGALPSGAAVADVHQQSRDDALKALHGGATEEEVLTDFVAIRARALLEGKMEPLPSNGRRPVLQ